ARGGDGRGVDAAVRRVPSLAVGAPAGGGAAALARGLPRLSDGGVLPAVEHVASAAAARPGARRVRGAALARAARWSGAARRGRSVRVGVLLLDPSSGRLVAAVGARLA